MLPIGVGQIDQPAGHHAAPARPAARREGRSADHPRVGAELGGADRRPRSAAAAPARAASRGAGSSSSSTERHHPAAEHDHVGVEGVGEAARAPRRAAGRSARATPSATGSPSSAAAVTAAPVDLARPWQAACRVPIRARARRPAGPRGRAPCPTRPPRCSRGSGSCPGRAGRRPRRPCGRARRRRRSMPRKSSPLRISPPPIPVPIVSMTAFVAPRAAPWRCSARAATLASLSSETGRPSRSAIRSRSGRSLKGQVDRVRRRRRGARSIVQGTPSPIAATCGRALTAARSSAASSSTSCSWRARSKGSRIDRRTSPMVARTPTRIFVPPRSTPIASAPLGQPEAHARSRYSEGIGQTYPPMARRRGRARLQRLPVTPEPACRSCATAASTRLRERLRGRDGEPPPSPRARGGPPRRREAALAPDRALGADLRGVLDPAQRRPLRGLGPDPEVQARRSRRRRARRLPRPGGAFAADDPGDRHRRPAGGHADEPARPRRAPKCLRQAARGIGAERRLLPASAPTR